MLSALTPVLIYRGLNLDNISVGDGPFSDGNGQHIHYISERAQGRQAKMKKVYPVKSPFNFMPNLGAYAGI